MAQETFDSHAQGNFRCFWVVLQEQQGKTICGCGTLRCIELKECGMGLG